MVKSLFSQKKTSFSIFSLLLVLCFGFQAYAEEPLICADDIEKYCKEVRPGGGRILKCLKTHELELSESCRKKMCEVEGIVKECEQACSDDIENFCRDIKPGEGRIVKCLREHEKRLSASCIEKLEMVGKKFRGGRK